MKKITMLFVISVSMIFSINADSRIVVVDGKKIILYDNFSWEYFDESAQKNHGIITLLKGPSSTKIYINKQKNYQVSINEQEWNETKSINQEAEFQFINQDKTGYCVVIYDGLPIPLENMEKILIDNAQRIDPAAKLISVEKCIVNNAHGELVTYTASTNGLDFTFFSFITSNEANGTIQFTFFTLSSYFENLRPLFLETVSGFEFLKQ